MNNNQKTQNQQQTTEQVQQVEVQNQQQQTEQQVVQPQVVVVEKKSGFGTWVKQHWKGLVAGVTGALAIGGSAVVAYKKGKAAGQVQQYGQQDYDDGSLNPNE